jgi:hypothetical protein
VPYCCHFRFNIKTRSLRTNSGICIKNWAVICQCRACALGNRVQFGVVGTVRRLPRHADDDKRAVVIEVVGVPQNINIGQMSQITVELFTLMADYNS